MRKQLEIQADLIEAVLAQHKTPGRVAGGTVTPRWIRFKIFPSLGTQISEVKSLSEELATALDVPSCRVARRGAAVMVEVPRADAREVELLPLIEELDDVPSMTAVLGISDDGAPLLIRLPSPDVGHILVSGTAGSGKTTLLRTMVASLAMRHPRRGELALVLIDPKGCAFADLAGLPQLARPVVHEGVAEVLAELVALMERRDARRESAPPLVVVIDELVDLMMTGGKDAEYQLTRLVQRGREAGIHVIAATQKPATVEELLKEKFPVRIVGKVDSAQDARVASGWPGTGAERLMGQGDFIAVAEGRTHRFQGAYITDEEMTTLISSAQIRKRPSRSRVQITALPAGG